VIPTIVGYYTTGTPYEAEAHTLALNLDLLELNYHIKAVPNLGSWQKNTQYKAHFVKEMLLAHSGEPLIYLDVDAEIKSTPIFLGNLKCDIAFHRFRGHELLSGTLYLGNTPKLMEVVDNWIALCAQYPERFPAGMLNHYPRGDIAWDQRMLDVAINRTCGVTAIILPPEYTFISDMSEKWYPGVKPIILHTAASRRYRELIR
jgi:hypothetical protein